MVTVLVVDDNSDIRSITAQFLKHRGYEVHEASSGEAAIEILKTARVDAVVADQLLPGTIKGVDVIFRHYKISPTGCRILLTAAFSDTLRSSCHHINSVYLQKPVPLDELVRKIEDSLAPYRP